MGKRATRIFFILGTVICAIVFICLAIGLNPALSDCKDIGRYTSYYVQGAHTVIFYNGPRPIAYFDIPYCSLSPGSTIRPVTSYVCDGDRIIIDGEACSIMTVSSSSTQSY
jgi:hypothetical protein